MAKFAFVVAATAAYREPVGVLINSIRAHHGDGVDIVLLTESDIPRHEDQLLYNYIWRLKVAAERTDYEAVCLVDADMFCVRSLFRYFEIAARAGQIIVSSDCTNVLYEQCYREMYPGILDEDFYNTRTFTSVPIFFSPVRHGDLFKAAYEYGARRGIVSDLVVLNMLACRHKFKDLLVLPAHAWTGIHHTYLKPELRLRKILGELVSEAGDEINMIHGRWFDAAWVEGLRNTMRDYFKNMLLLSEEGANRHMGLVDDTIQVCLTHYNRYSSL